MASGQHQPLNRLAGRCAREGVALSLSTLADQVGAVAAALAPLHALIAAHVMAAGRLHGDDTTVPPPAKGKTETARWAVSSGQTPEAGRSAAEVRPPPCCAARATAGASVRNNISPDGGASCRPTPIPASTPCSAWPGNRGRSCPHSVGRMCGGSSSSWPPSSPTPGAAKRRRRSRRWRWRP